MRRFRGSRGVAVIVALVVALGGGQALPVAAQDPGVLSVAMENGISTLDPAVAYDIDSWMAGRLLYDQLVTYDAGTTLVPGLAAAMPEPAWRRWQSCAGCSRRSRSAGRA